MADSLTVGPVSLVRSIPPPSLPLITRFRVDAIARFMAWGTKPISLEPLMLSRGAVVNLGGTRDSRLVFAGVIFDLLQYSGLKGSDLFRHLRLVSTGLRYDIFVTSRITAVDLIDYKTAGYIDITDFVKLCIDRIHSFEIAIFDKQEKVWLPVRWYSLSRYKDTTSDPLT